MNSLTTTEDTRLSAPAEPHPFRRLAWCALLAAALWWIALPALIAAKGEHVQVRVVDTWETNSYITIFFYETQLMGTRLAITLPEGDTREVTKYCAAEVVQEGPVRPGALLTGRYSRAMPRRLALPESGCDAPTTWFIGLALLTLGGYMAYRWYIRDTPA